MSDSKLAIVGLVLLVGCNSYLPVCSGPSDCASPDEPAASLSVSSAGSPAPENSSGTAEPFGAGREAGQDEEAAAGGAGSALPALARCGDGMIEVGETCDGNCPTACSRPSACVESILTGDASHCSSRCEFHEISACVSGDGCCPSGCKYPSDRDCSGRCGDGVVDVPETCEPGTVQDCPSSCDDRNACTSDVKSGSAETCSVSCSHMPVTRPANDDGCCPAGANANNDNDCKATCGNGLIEAGETCDGRCPTSCDDADPCSTDTREGSPGTCNVACKHTRITTPSSGDGCCPVGANANNDKDCSPRCGNGVTEAGETCDGSCRSTCDDANPCTKDASRGNSRTCDFACSNEPITISVQNDGCCPFDATYVTDNDCTNTCGNGRRDPGEMCDGDTCPDPAHPEYCELDPCVTYTIVGGACFWHCELVALTPPGWLEEACDMFLADLPWRCKGGTPVPDLLKACERHGMPWQP